MSSPFAARYPRVWHVMEAECAGCGTLYPAAALGCLAGLPLDGASRDDFQRLTLPGGGTAVLRKQLMPDQRLIPTLRGSFAGRPDLWRGHINRHVFFWVRDDQCNGFRKACARDRARGVLGSGSAPLMIQIDTAALLAEHHEMAFFSLINAGSTNRGGARARRDENTLRPLHTWRRERVVELAIRRPVNLPPGTWEKTSCGQAPP
jgi:hypothetical protein